MGPGSDVTSYRAGQADRQSDIFNQSQQESGEKKSSDAWVSPQQKVEVDGVAFTIMLIAPILYMVYPILGSSLYAAFGLTVLLCNIFHISMLFGITLGFFAAVAAFFWAFKWEARVSGYKLYRTLRIPWRLINVFGLVAAIVSGKMGAFSAGRSLTPGGIVSGVIAAVIAHIVFKLLDGVYFSKYIPAPKAGTKEAIQLEAATPILVSGEVGEAVRVSKKEWTFRVGDQPAVMKNANAEMELQNGDFVHAAGLRGPALNVLAIRNKRYGFLYEAHNPKAPWVLTALGCFAVALFLKPIFALFLLYFPGRKLNQWRKRNLATWASRDMIGALEAP